MSAEIGTGPLWPIDGPPPIAPKLGLLQAARSASAVRIVPDADAGGRERWINGAALHPYPTDAAHVFDACAIYDSGGGEEKESGDQVPLPKFDAFTVYLPISCTAFQVPDQDAFKARAVAALTAVEGAAIERELQSGETMLLNPHLADGQGEFPWGNTPTSIANGLAVLENELATQGHGRAGIIHISPGLAAAAGAQNLIDEGGALRTYGGTLVVAGSGYAQGSDPALHDAATGTEEWVYATGPIDVRRSEVFTIPETAAQALDRGMGASMDVPNQLVYRAERYYLVTWDTAVQAAVLIDRCLDSCEA